MKAYLDTKKTIAETIHDLKELFADMGVKRWYALPAEGDESVKVLFLWQEHRWISASSALQPTREGNARMCYRALYSLREMEVRGVTKLVQHLATEMGLVVVNEGRDNLLVERAILGVGPDASLKEIKQAYREKVKLVHPDSNGGVRDADMFRAVDMACKRLTKRSE